MASWKRFIEVITGSLLLVAGCLVALIWLSLIWPLTQAFVALSAYCKKVWLVQRMESWGRKLWRRWRNKTHYF